MTANLDKALKRIYRSARVTELEVLVSTREGVECLRARKFAFVICEDKRKTSVLIPDSIAKSQILIIPERASMGININSVP